MVKGRLPRESNPLPGDKSGFVASHDTTGEEDYKRTSPLNPLPVTSIGDSNVKDAAVKAELELIKQGIADNKATNDLILARLDNPIDTQLTGSNVEDGIAVKQASLAVDFKEVTLNETELLGAGMTRNYQLYANPNEIWRVTRMGYHVRKESTATGDLRISIYHGTNYTSQNFVAMIETNSNIYARGTIPGVRESSFGGDVTPSDSYELIEALRDTTIMSDKLPLTFRVRNSTDEDVTIHGFKVFVYVERVS